MSNDRSGLPVMVTAVRHLVCVVVGAPGPVHGAATAPVVPSDTAPMTAGATVPRKYARSLAFLVITSSHGYPKPAPVLKYHIPRFDFTMFFCRRTTGMCCGQRVRVDRPQPHSASRAVAQPEPLTPA